MLLVLVDLRPEHIDARVSTQLAAGLGRTTVHHAVGWPCCEAP
ncbi:hypothetical protein [Streptomyces sp. XY431]|nr:hypothetical protein [Streptomyces sp. XY431]